MSKRFDRDAMLALPHQDVRARIPDEGEDREQVVYLPSGNPVIWLKHYIIRSEITGAYHEVPAKISELITEFDRELMRGCVAL